MKQLISNYTSYNVWANKKMAVFLSQLDHETLDKNVISSFTSIRQTVHHIWDAELIWLSRLQQKNLSWPPSAAFKDPKITDFVNASEAINNFVLDSNNDFFTSNTTYQNSEGREFSNDNATIIMHCMNHSTFHRGQLVTLLRQSGFTQLSSTDFITFARQ